MTLIHLSVDFFIDFCYTRALVLFGKYFLMNFFLGISEEEVVVNPGCCGVCGLGT